MFASTLLSTRSCVEHLSGIDRVLSEAIVARRFRKSEGNCLSAQRGRAGKTVAARVPGPRFTAGAATRIVSDDVRQSFSDFPKIRFVTRPSAP